jgi:exonuclease VII large subunit
MAEQLSDSADEKRLDLLREIEEANQRIEEQNKKAAVVGAEERKRLEKRIEREKEKLKELQKQVKPLEQQNTLAEEYNDLQDKIWKSMVEINKHIDIQLEQDKLDHDMQFKSSYIQHGDY